MKPNIVEVADPMPTQATAVFRGELFTVWQWPQTLYDGSTATFERVSRPDAVWAIGVLPDRSILLVEDTQPDRGTVLTPAGGRIEPNESPDAAIRREFQEETGYAIGTLVPWYTHRMSIKVESSVHTFIARDLTEVATPNPDAGERISVQTYSWTEFIQLGQNPQLRDYILRITLLEAQLDSAKQNALQQLLYGS